MTGDDTEAAVRDLYLRLLRAWNERDAGRYAALFADDAVVVGFDGSQMTGTEIGDHIGVIFRDHPTASYVAKVRRVRRYGEAAALLTAIVGMVPPGKRDVNPAVNAVQTLLAEHGPDGWRIVLFQNTPAQYHGRPELAERHTDEMRQVLAGGATLV
ncbi:MAG TPA: SgcJ/EcaC family oxidoreductase [Micromonosporaceae bacterium]